MTHVLIQNVLVILLVGLGMFLTYNPLFILGLMFLAGLPYEPSQPPEEQEDYPPQAVGFTQDIE